MVDHVGWGRDMAAGCPCRVADPGGRSAAGAGRELQLAIYPWGYQRGPIFDISGHAGALTARDIQGSERSVSGATLEDLVAAVRQIPDLPADDSMFRWVRQVASLPAALP